MGPLPDLPDLLDLLDLLRGAVLAVLALATGYHLLRLLRRPLVAVDGAHALMGGVMLLMLAGRVGHGAALGWAALFVAVGVAGAFTSRVELAIGSAAMVFMLLAAPVAVPMAEMPGMAEMPEMPEMAGMSHATPGPAGGVLGAVLVVVLVMALAAVVAHNLLAARASSGRTGSGISIACRVGLNLAAVYMLVPMI